MNFINQTDTFLKKWSEARLINLVFVLYLVIFLIDNIVNKFVHMPIFVAGGMALLVLFVPYLWADRKKNIWIIAGMMLLPVLMVVNSIKDGFHIKNVSDLFFLVLFVVAFLAFYQARRKLRPQLVYAFALSSALLFLLPLLVARYSDNDQLNRMVYATGRYTQFEVTEKIQHDEKNEQGQLLDARSEDSVQQSKTVTARRYYRRGFFRVYHVASCLLGFSSLFF